MHIVHYNSKYGSFEAAEKEPDGLAALAVLIEVGGNYACKVIDWHPHEALNVNEGLPSCPSSFVPEVTIPEKNYVSFPRGGK